MLMARAADMLVLGAEQIITCAPSGYPIDGPLAGAAAADAGIIDRGAMAVCEGTIAMVGSENEVLECFPPLKGHTAIVRVDGKIVAPGFVAAHTHLVYAGSRHREHAMRLAGARYLDILAAGGGIISTVKATRAASLEELTAITRQRLATMLLHGTTTVEAKSGYGLTKEDELKQLKAAADAGAGGPVDVVSTFMGAHAVPPEFTAASGGGGADAYIDYLCAEVIPAVAEQGIAEFCDVFCETGVFTVEQSRRVLAAGQARGMRAKIHADEINPSGGAELAADLGAVSAEHLAAASPEGIRRMAEAGVIAVLLPATMFTLMSSAYADARAMIAAGVPVALATDFNPGTSPTMSMPFVMTLACLQMKMTPQEAMIAATRNAAWAVGRGHTAGMLASGRPATFVVLNAEHIDALPFFVGMNPVTQVFVGGRPVVWQSSEQCDWRACT